MKRIVAGRILTTVAVATLVAAAGCGGDDGGSGQSSSGADTTAFPVDLEPWPKQPAGFITLSLVEDWEVLEFDGTDRAGTGAYTGAEVEKVLDAEHPTGGMASLEIYRQRDVEGAPPLEQWAADVAASFSANGIPLDEPTADTVGGQPALRLESTDEGERAVVYAIAVGPERLALVLNYQPVVKPGAGLRGVVEAMVDSITFDPSILDS